MTQKIQANGAALLPSRLLHWFTEERHSTRALSAVRIGYGVTTFLFLIVNLPVRQQLWGVESAYDWELFMEGAAQGSQPSLYALSSSALWADVLYFGLMVMALLFALGWHTRVITVVFYVLLWSLHARNPLVTNGGDNLVRIILIYLMFAQTAAHWSLDARRNRRRVAAGRVQHDRLAGTIFHNGALIACVTQICILYLASGLFKVQGRMWQEGTAVYYVMRTADFNAWPELSALVYQWPVVVVAATYAAVFVQLAIPLALINPVAKRIVLPAVLGMHLGIGFFMGLPYFSLYMIVSDLLLLSNKDMHEMGMMLQRWWRKVAEGLGLRSKSGVGPGEAEAKAPPLPPSNSEDALLPAQLVKQPAG